MYLLVAWQFIGVLCCAERGSLSQALGLHFRAESISEANPSYRAVILENHCDKVESMFDDVNKQVESWDQGCPDVGITGSPCNPFSTQRVKRYVQGSVSCHTAFETTMTSIISFYQTVEPKLGVTEQVAGFDQPIQAGSESTPMRMLPDIFGTVSLLLISSSS